MQRPVFKLDLSCLPARMSTPPPHTHDALDEVGLIRVGGEVYSCSDYKEAYDRAPMAGFEIKDRHLGSHLLIAKSIRMCPGHEERSATAQIVREANKLMRSTQACPTIIDYYGLDVHPITGTGWVFMEPMAISMDALCLTLGADEYFSEDVLANCALSVFEGLRYMEVHEMAHTHVKPSTIFRNADGEFKISILPLFHLPTPLSFARSPDDRSFSYTSPDRIKPSRVQGMAPGSMLSGQDVWGFGLTLCEFAMKEYPFGEHVNIYGALQAIVDGGAPPMPDRYSADLRDFVRQCLVHEAAQRPGFAQPSFDGANAALEDHPFYRKQSVRLWRVELHLRRCSLTNPGVPSAASGFVRFVMHLGEAMYREVEGDDGEMVYANHHHASPLPAEIWLYILTFLWTVEMKFPASPHCAGGACTRACTA